MESNSSMVESHKKMNLSNPSNNNEDFISQLPDEIITQVLSYVPTKSAVATCVLSKRWRDLWISVPNLDFNIHSFATSDEFESCVDRVLSTNKVLSVRNVELECGYYHRDVLHLNAWIRSLVARDAEKFYLSLPYSYSCPVENINVPVSFFNQNRLVILQLKNVSLKVLPLVCFPCLETIKLAPVQIFDDESMKNLLAGCPVLTDLCIIRYTWVDKQTLYICSSTLQNLEIHTHKKRGCVNKVVIDAVKLRYINLKDWAGTRYSITVLPSLQSANLSTYEKSPFKLLRKISHVKELFLHEPVLDRFVETPNRELRMFHNLTQLTLEIEFPSELAAVWSRILPYTPDGVHIIFVLINGHPHCPWFESLDLPESVISSIESVEITTVHDMEYMTLISCLIKNATTTKTLTFHGFPVYVVKNDEFLKTFLPISEKKERKLNKRFCDVTNVLGSLPT